jgi:rhamnosyltransferase subunit B
MSQWLNSPQRVICAFPDWFAAKQIDWPANSMTVDFPRWNSPTGARLDPLLEEFLQSGPAPIGITPGSAMTHGHDLFARALAACTTLGLRAIVITPFRDQLPASLPDSVRHVSYAPFDLLLPRLRALVHHGGIGTLAQGLIAGVPQYRRPDREPAFVASALRGRGRSIGVGSEPLVCKGDGSEGQ